LTTRFGDPDLPFSPSGFSAGFDVLRPAATHDDDRRGERSCRLPGCLITARGTRLFNVDHHQDVALPGRDGCDFVISLCFGLIGRRPHATAAINNVRDGSRGRAYLSAIDGLPAMAPNGTQVAERLAAVGG